MPVWATRHVLVDPRGDMAEDSLRPAVEGVENPSRSTHPYNIRPLGKLGLPLLSLSYEPLHIL